MTKPKGVPISIFGKALAINCPDGQKQALLSAAEFLDNKMRESQSNGRILNFEDRILLTALNIAHEYLQVEAQKNHSFAKFVDKIQYLENKIEHMLEKNPVKPTQAPTETFFEENIENQAEVLESY